MELLRIVLQAQQYQPAAVAAAREVLATRTVTDDDHADAAESIAPKPRIKPALSFAPTPESSAAWQPGEDLFIDVDAPPPFAAIRQRWRILTVVLGLFIFYFALRGITAFTRPHQIAGANWDNFANLAILILQVTGYALYWRRHRWGWILTVAWLCCLTGIGFFSLTALITGHFISYAVSMCFRLLLFFGCARILCSPLFTRFYRIDKKTLVLTFLLSIGGTVMYCILATAIMYYLSDLR